MRTRSLALFLTSLMFSACATKPVIAPAPSELKYLFYSLYQSNFSGYRCEVHSEMLQTMSEFEYNMLFKELYKREPTLKERGMLKKVKWTVANSNQKQEVLVSPALKEFPTEETRELVEKITLLLTIMNKVMTLTYIETFADRPDLAVVHIGEKFYQVIGHNEEVVAELEFNRRKYRIFFGSRKDQIEVSLSKLGSMEIPEKMELKSAEHQGVFYPRFEIRQGYPQLDRIDVMIPQLGTTLLKFPFELCQYTKL